MSLKVVRIPDGDAWGRLMEAWGALLDRYQALTLSAPDPDVAYWHREESLTGLLATAAWQIEGAGVEGAGLVEFSTTRTWPLPEESGTGAGDAWLRIGDRWYTVEAKLCWSSSRIRASLTQAKEDLGSLPESDRGEWGVAVCYCVPELKSPPRAGLMEKLGEDLAAEFPEEELVVVYTPHGSAPEHGGLFYPGVAVVGRVVRWSHGGESKTS